MRYSKIVCIIVFLAVLTGWVPVEAKENPPNPVDDPKGAVDFWDAVISLDTQNAVAFHERGKAYKGMGQYQHAIEDYNQAIGLNSKFAEAYHNRGVAYKQLKKYQICVN